MENNKVSVVVPAYNAEKTIENTLEKILGGYNNVEVIVVNDGSTDNTENIVKSFIKRDNRVKLVSQVNSGVGVARCRGIKESSGNYIAFCDADDWFEDNFLQEHLKHLEKYNAEISMCRTHITGSADIGNSDDVSIKEKTDIVKDYLNYCGITVSLWDKVYKRELLDNKEIINDLRYSEDLYMNYIACKYANRIIKFNTTKYNWFNNPTSLSRGRFNPVKLENDFSAWDKIITDCNKNHPKLEETARLSSELWIAGTYRSMVNSHYHNKELEKKIARYIRQDGIIKTLAAEKNRANKRFIRLAMISMPLARYTWYVLTGAKRMVKKVIRR